MYQSPDITNTYTHTHTDTHTHLLQQINKLSKVAGYRINTQKLLLYINNYNPKKEIKKTISFTIGPKRIKYLGIHLTKEAKKKKTYKLETIKHC